MLVKTKREAMVAGRHLKSLMKTSGWKVCVWNNLGWYYNIKKENVVVNPDSNHRMGGSWYWCEVEPSYAFWSDGRSYRDPNMAVQRAISKVRKEVEEFKQILSKAEAAKEA